MKIIKYKFTLVELLTVCGILAILFALLVPVIHSAKKSTQDTSCKSNLKQLVTACLHFATEHNQQLPGSYFDEWTTFPDRNDWIGVGPNNTFDSAPESGTLYPYLKSTKVYRCPSLTEEPLNSGVGSNGHFDYVKFGAFSGARLITIDANAEIRNGSNRTIMPTPLLIEEHPACGLNSKDAPEGHFTGCDRLAVTHSGNCNMAAVSGSVHTVQDTESINCGHWYTKTPSGEVKTLGNAVWVTKWGWWQSY